ncbi:hypothetical protein BASA81_007405 [Batrachochytrium salamandrivorans]|nr:hypothetical protein BASA81_007405 [Batrachochytrium salamandrivorans]
MFGQASSGGFGGGFGAPQQQQQQQSGGFGQQQGFGGGSALFGAPAASQGFSQQQQPMFGAPQQTAFGQPAPAAAPAWGASAGGGAPSTPGGFGAFGRSQTTGPSTPGMFGQQQQPQQMGQFSNQAELHNPNNATELKREDRPSDSITATKFSSLDGSMVSVSSWDGSCKVFQLTPKDYTGVGQVNLKASLPTTNLPVSPILDTCWRQQAPILFTAQANGTVAMWDLASNQAQQVGRHDSGVKTVHWIQDMNFLVTGGWDKTVRYWDLRQPNPVETLQMPERVHCMSVRFPTEVVVCAPIKSSPMGGGGMFATAGQGQAGELKVPCMLYDLRNAKIPVRDSFVSSSTAHQVPKLPIRTVSISTDGSFFACAGTEGRVIIQHVNEQQKAQNFTFRAHKHEENRQGVNTTINNPINDIQFHPHSNVFATCGSDGSFCFWDHGDRARLYHGPQTPSPNQANTKDAVKRCHFPNNQIAPLLASGFNPEGSMYAYAVGYDWGGGGAYNSPDQVNTVLFHQVSPNEVKPGPKTQGGTRRS